MSLPPELLKSPPSFLPLLFRHHIRSIQTIDFPVNNLKITDMKVTLLPHGYPIAASAYMRKSIGRNLRWMRLNAGMSQEEVADKAGMRPEVISRLESGRGNPTVRTVERVVVAIKKGVAAANR
jgi:DNA-binding XRE family transcriptional regulator